MNIQLSDKDYNYTIDECLLHKYENVSSYKYALCKMLLSITIENNHNNDNTDPEIYYVFDCPGEDAFAHWVFECFIFYPIFLKIRNIYPNIKILSSNTKKYVKNMFRFLNIQNDVVESINRSNNVCFFSPIVSLNELNSNNGQLYRQYVYNMISDIETYNSRNCLNKNKILFLPRNSKDNYKSNTRIIHGSEDIEENVINRGGIVLNTYQINNINLQCAIVNSSEIIILDYGSSFWFNALFCKNKKIIVLDEYNLYLSQVSTFHSFKVLIEIISNNNNVIVVNRSGGIYFKDIVDYLT